MSQILNKDRLKQPLAEMLERVVVMLERIIVASLSFYTHEPQTALPGQLRLGPAAKYSASDF